jgi:hypothetical protein
MKSWQLQVVMATLGVLATGGALATYNHYQREIGRRDILLAQADTAHRAAMRQADSLAKAYRPDTVRLTKWRTKWDSTGLRRLEHTLDSLQRLGVAHPETVTVEVPVSDLVTADTTIRACTMALRTCEQRVGAERDGRLAAERQVKLLEQQLPGAFTPWRHRAEGAVAGVLVRETVRWLAQLLK